MPRDFTVLAPIIPGHETELNKTLTEIGEDVLGRRLQEKPDSVHVHFNDSVITHFARFVIIADPDRGKDRKRLLFSTNFDGDLDSYLAELEHITTDLQAIWGHCEGFAESDTFADYLKAHSQDAQAYYIAFRDQTVVSIRRYRDELDALQDKLDDPQEAETWVAAHEAKNPAAEFAGELRDVIWNISHFLKRFFGQYLPLLGGIGKMAEKHGVRNVWRSSKRITATLNRIWYFKLFNMLTNNSEPPQPSPYSSVEPNNCNPCVALAPGDEVTAGPNGMPPDFVEDIILQNQLTMIVVIEPKYLQRLMTVLDLIDNYSRYLAPTGSLAGMSTIHFVRWIVIDDGKRMMMLSNYDGTWEAYIGEFAEMILSGLNAIWENFVGWREAGAGDVDAFKRFLRCHQEQAQVFYSAYPFESVLNIKQAIDIHREMHTTQNPDEIMRLLSQA